MSSTNFTIPRGVKKIDCFCVGGGGAGGYGFSSSGSQLGASSKIGNLCEAFGGNLLPEYGIFTNFIGYGGSAGGEGMRINIKDNPPTIMRGKSGCADGGGAGGIKGQGTTTRYFGESNGTLYAGGGGGYIYVNSVSFAAFFDESKIMGGAGGAGGGGNGGAGYYDSVREITKVTEYPTPGSPNTGGGGGGCITGLGISGGGGGYTTTKLAQSVNPGSVIPIVVGAGEKRVPDSSSSYPITVNAGGSGICIIRWSGK